MNVGPSKAVKRLSTIAALTLTSALFLAPPVTCRADILYVSYVNAIEKYDLATGADLGALATLPSGTPLYLALDGVGNLYAANSGNDTIMKFTPDGVGSVFTSFGVSAPTGLALDDVGNLYVANSGNNTIMKYAPDGAGSVFANTGVSDPRGLAFDSAGNLYVANNAITGSIGGHHLCQPRPLPSRCRLQAWSALHRASHRLGRGL